MNKGHWKRCFIGLGLAALLLVAACAPPPTPTPTPSPTPTPPLETLTYNNSAYGFSLEYPKDWEAREEFIATIVTFVGPVEEATGGAININIAATQPAESPEVTLEEYVRLFKLRVKADAENYEELDEYNTVVDDRVAIVWTYKEDFARTPLMVTMAFFMKENVVYAISYGATPELYYDYLGCFELVLGTFQFD
jgi:hypothetical protein